MSNSNSHVATLPEASSLDLAGLQQTGYGS
jgi:hypothetical protein